MHDGLFAVRPLVQDSSRLPVLSVPSRGIQIGELAWLLLMGFAASAATVLIDFKWGFPGHAILRSIVPLTLGLAVVPRRNAGLVMSAAAVSGAFGLQAMYAGSAGAGALTSLLMAGLLLDLAVSQARRGWQLYLSVAGAALATNVVAFGVRLLSKSVGWEAVGRRPLSAWWPHAAVTYPLFGLVAGLLVAIVLFRARERCPDGNPS